MRSALNVQRSDVHPLDLDVDLAVVAIGDDLDGFAAIDARFGGALAGLASRREFTGKKGQSLSVPTLGTGTAAELMLVGVGDRSVAALREAAGAVGNAARNGKASSVAIDLGELDGPAQNQVLESLAVGNYRYQPYLPEDKRTPALTDVHVCGTDLDASRVAAAAARATWQAFTRDLVNQPPADLYPETLAEAALTLAEIPDVSVEVWDEDKLQAEGYVGIIAVGQGSAKPPRMVHIRYRPLGAKAHVALVGKGVTFDSGGLSLKPSGAMQTMRCDMGGAGTVLGVVGAVAAQGVPVAIDAVIGCAENMAAANSYKLGDILSYRNGVTVEIHNTDAEGRLVLADCLIHACEQEGVTHLVDLATLTGACVVAVGPDFTGLFTKSDDFADTLQAAADVNGEGTWRLPLHDGYNRMLKGEWGQIKNVGGRDAGATTAALFLQHFVDTDKVTWAHMDIAGSAFQDSQNGPYTKGGTGQMVRSLATWIEGLA